MATGGSSALLSAISLWICFGRAAADLQSSHVCYILDGILFLYGILLTVLYCRMKILNAREAKAKAKPKTEEGIYSGLSPHTNDTYETLGQKM